MSDFADRLIRWQKRHGRHNLPWQRDWHSLADPYRVWLAEIMLQQTQVATVIPYYERFLARFPTLVALAAAPVAEVMERWSGLGYYARARNLHRCAQVVMAAHCEQFPRAPQALAELPGIGRSTANAIAAFSFGVRVPILDGNVKRVLCRCFGIEGFPGTARVESRLWRHAESLLPDSDIATYIQAQMDLGATVCTRTKPRCDACPLHEICIARHEDRTAALPTPRPRKALPDRQSTLLILRRDGLSLLERRPPSGIWGGLLSLPELPPDAEARAYIEENLGWHVLAVSLAPTFWHTFTHFRLHIQPLVCEVRTPGGARRRAAEPTQYWLTAEELARAALPAPVRQLLSAIP